MEKSKIKKIAIGVVALVVFIVLALAYLNWRNYSLSPRGTETLNSGGMTVTVNYCRPSVRGRVIFGSEAQDPLLPYGEYWRLGANDATEITFNRDILFNGAPVKAGTYRMYAIPGPGNFEIALNNELGKWGAYEPDYEEDVLRTKVPVRNTDSPVEQFTISLAPAGEGMEMIFEWSTTRFTVPLQPR